MDKSYFKGLIQDVLNKEFNSSQRQKIVEYNDRLNFCCPLCGDSAKSASKKRGNLYLNSLKFKCFNCGQRMGIDKFCSRYDIKIDSITKMEIIKHIESTISYNDYEDEVLSTQFDMLIDLDDLIRIFNDKEHILTDFKPVTFGSQVYGKLTQRSINDELHTNIYQAKHWIGPDTYEWVMCFLNKKGKHVIGMQIRNLKEGKARNFKIFNFETLYKWVNNTDEINSEIIDISKLTIYNKLGYYFNILNVDFNKVITVFEGYLDSLFFPNSIGVVGVETDMRFLESNDINIRYVYDNDDAGYRKTEEKINSNFKVFLWNKLFKYIADSKKNVDKYALEYRVSKIKDMNNLAELVINPYSKLKLEHFFSIDKYDLKWVNTYKKYTKYKKMSSK